MGARMDPYGPSAAVRMVAALAATLTVMFGGIWVHFRAAGIAPSAFRMRGFTTSEAPGCV